MFVCLCKSVTDHEIKASVEEGVASFEAMQQRLEVATVCGSCSCEVKKIMQAKIQKELNSRPAPVVTSGNGVFA